MSNYVVRRLRPYLFSGFLRAQAAQPSRALSQTCYRQDGGFIRDVTHDYEKRVAQLEAQTPLHVWYPRLPSNFAETRTSLGSAKSRAINIEKGGTEDSHIIVAGRINSVRRSGSKLIFIDVRHDSVTLQIVVKPNETDGGDLTIQNVREFGKTLRKGDWLVVKGLPHRTARNEPSVLATQLPTLVSPSLHQIPETLDDVETRARKRHVDMLVHPNSIHTLRVRHQVEGEIARFLDARLFTKVTTPILSAGAGGAVARPFKTTATELEGHTLNLRIAPELWLKRLIVGGLAKVYEMGPAFRNEGVDATHNPEFTICEFYEAFATLEDLMKTTQEMLSAVQNAVNSLRHGSAMEALDMGLAEEYKRLEFVPALQEQIGMQLPDLASPEAREQIFAIFDTKSLLAPAIPTLPRLLDALAAHYLEPLCTTPTFIINHPACLSPLSKHFTCPSTSQVVAARAELFIAGREYANMYEEENSPFEQRRKFMDQLKYREVDGEGDGKSDVDESYLEALEWGLPPTGGWGCGVDRLVMLLAERERIGDVLAFGGLRNVVGLGKK